MFKTYKALIDIEGRGKSRVWKGALTAPELVILQEVHGVGSVTGIEEDGGSFKESSINLRRALFLKYQSYKVEGKPVDIVSKMFGGKSSELPVNIDGLGFDAYLHDSPPLPTDVDVAELSARAEKAEADLKAMEELSESDIQSKDAEIAAKDAEIADKEAESERLRAELVKLQSGGSSDDEKPKGKGK